MDGIKITDAVNACVVRGRGIEEKAPVEGVYNIELWSADGVLKHKETIENTVVNAGKNSLLGIMFHADSQISAWYFGIIDNSGFSAIASGDTMASHAGWNEFTNYSNSTRVAWSPGSAASQSITNGTAATFLITGSGTLNGIFLTSVSTISGSTGTLWCGTSFSSTVPVSNGDQLKVTYTVSC